MSYSISLCCPVSKSVLHLDAPHQMMGGTCVLGGTTAAELNVTYNYGAILRRVINPEKGIRAIENLTGAESLPILKQAISVLKDDVNSDYWAATEGNVKVALNHLLALATMRPDGVWCIK